MEEDEDKEGESSVSISEEDLTVPNRFFADPSKLVYLHELGLFGKPIERSKMEALEVGFAELSNSKSKSSRPSMSSQVLMTESGDNECSGSVGIELFWVLQSWDCGRLS